MKMKDMDSGLLKDDSNQDANILEVQHIRPWANTICKFKLPDSIFGELKKLYEYTMNNKKSFGKQLVGQIDDEPEVTQEILDKFPEWHSFCNHTVSQYIKSCMADIHIAEPEKLNKLLSEKLLTRITTMWFVNQKPGEYNPVHIHTNCKVSSVVYLETPKQQVKDRKEHYQSDGKITFMNNTGTDMNFSNSQCSFEPKPGDMYVFGSLQHHMVWPYRSADPNDKRVSLSFNAEFTTEKTIQMENKNQEMMYESMKKMKESENDKSTDVSDINKSG